MAKSHTLRKVRIEGGYLNFSAAHFVTYEGQCERLHGHNYRVQVEIEGELNQDKLVFDFTTLKRVTREICQQLDHRFLLPMYNPHFELIASLDSWEMRYQERRYVFPRSDVVELPIDNSTAERLAEHICNELYTVLKQRYDIAHLASITIGVEEAPMQVAFYQLPIVSSL